MNQATSTLTRAGTVREGRIGFDRGVHLLGQESHQSRQQNVTQFVFCNERLKK